MKTNLLRCLSGILAGVAVAATPNLANAADNEQPAAAIFYPLVGDWTGSGQLSEPGGQPVELSIDLSCVKAAGGWAVRCEMTASNAGMIMNESDLMGVDPITGKGHWYAITDQGDAHDHIVSWSDANDMTATYSWEQDGKQMTENITMKFGGENSVDFASVVKADSKEVNTFAGKLEK